jgi:hypothetical protein
MPPLGDRLLQVAVRVPKHFVQARQVLDLEAKAQTSNGIIDANFCVALHEEWLLTISISVLLCIMHVYIRPHNVPTPRVAPRETPRGATPGPAVGYPGVLPGVALPRVVLPGYRYPGKSAHGRSPG